MYVAIMVGTDGKVFRYITLTEVCLLCSASEGFNFKNIPVAGFKMSHSRASSEQLPVMIDEAVGSVPCQFCLVA